MAKKLTLQDFQEKLKIAHPKEDLEAISWDGGKKDGQVKCRTCGNLYTKKGDYFLDKRKVSICKVCFPTHDNTFKTDWQPPEGYTQVGEYKGMQHKILIKHDACGFIWEITPANLKLGKGCPKCNKRTPKGEQKIIKWLEDNQIKYQTQVPIRIDGHNNMSIDFYLPDFDLYIEYNGEQHYHPIEHFGSWEKFNQQVHLDFLKAKELKNRLLVIPYTEFNDLENILRSSTTIPQGSTSQATGDGSGKIPNKE